MTAGRQARLAIRLIVVVVLGLAAILGISMYQSQSPGSSDPVEGLGAANSTTGASRSGVQASTASQVAVREVESAKGAASVLPADRYGVECLMVGSGLRHYPSDYADRLDERITEAQVGVEGWVAEGRIWVGTADGAAEAFNATDAFSDHDSVWIVRESKDGPRANELLLFKSSSGKSTWQLGDQIAECNSTDPASDDDEGSG